VSGRTANARRTGDLASHANNHTIRGNGKIDPPTAAIGVHYGLDHLVQPVANGVGKTGRDGSAVFEAGASTVYVRGTVPAFSSTLHEGAQAPEIVMVSLRAGRGSIRIDAASGIARLQANSL
jgi:hypothetical protein